MICLHVLFYGEKNRESIGLYINIGLPEINSSHLKMDGWNAMSFPLGWPIFRVDSLVLKGG